MLFRSASEKLQEIAKKYYSSRNTTRLISWVSSQIEMQLLDEANNDEFTTGMYIAMLNALYRLKQFEGLIKESTPETKAVEQVLNMARIIGEEQQINEQKNG